MPILYRSKRGFRVVRSLPIYSTSTVAFHSKKSGTVYSCTLSEQSSVKVVAVLTHQEPTRSNVFFSEILYFAVHDAANVPYFLRVSRRLPEPCSGKILSFLKMFSYKSVFVKLQIRTSISLSSTLQSISRSLILRVMKLSSMVSNSLNQLCPTIIEKRTFARARASSRISALIIS